MTPERISATVGTAGSGVALIFGLNANELAALGGFLVAFLGFAANVWITYHFKEKAAQLARETMERNTIMHLPVEHNLCPSCLANLKDD